MLRRLLARLLPARLLLAPLLLGFAAAAGADPATDPLAPLAHWVGGRWVAEVDLGNGRRMKLVRSYAWSFDRRLLIGRSFGERDGKSMQTRETVYFWNADSRRIEFTDFIDEGGFGSGHVERRDGQLLLEAKIVGNSKHPSWRAWMREGEDTQALRVEALRDGQWVDYGTFPYRRER